MSGRLPGVPAEIASALERLADNLLSAAGQNLAGLILYGGLARGRYRPGKSDVNIVVLLREITAGGLAALGPALQAERRSANVSAMILTVAEVSSMADSFPTKFLDIKDHHIVLYGEDPFRGLDVPREQIRLRVVQELRNLTLRLRQRFVAVVDDPDMQTVALAGLARPLAIELSALLRLADKPAPREDHSDLVFQAAAVAFDVDGEALACLATLRRGEGIRPATQALFARVLAALDRLTGYVERMKERS